MGSSTRRSAIVLTVALTPLVVASLASAADTTVGDATAPGNMCSGIYTRLQTAAPAGPSYAVPAGVITTVHITGDDGAPSNRGFKLGRAVGGGTWTIVASTPMTTLAAGTTSNDKVRIPTHAGDVLGEVSSGNNTKCIRGTGNAADAITYTSSDVPVGSTLGGAPSTGGRVPVSVVVEPDVDLDGYGDTTQDACPTVTATQGVCAFTLGAPTGKRKVGRTLTAPAVSVAPSTTVTFQWFRVTKKKHRPAKVIAISGATGATYKLKAKDRGKQVYVHVVLSRTGFAPASADSSRKRIH